MKKLSVSPYLVIALILSAWLGRMQSYCAALLSIFLHECAHAAVAWVLDVSMEGICLHPFGASLTLACDLSEDPKCELIVAAAGPAASFFSALLFHTLYLHNDLELFFLLYRYSMVFGLFNLLPALPMDGGRMLRSALGWLGVRRGHVLAADLGIVLGGMMVLFACAAWRTYGVNVTLLCCGGALIVSAIGEKRKKGRYLLDAYAKLRRLNKGKILPVQTIAVGGDTALWHVLRTIGPAHLYRIEIYDENMRKLGQTDEIQAAHFAAKYGKSISVKQCLPPYLH